jgi:hypothetical protein
MLTRRMNPFEAPVNDSGAPADAAQRQQEMRKWLATGFVFGFGFAIVVQIVAGIAFALLSSNP